jgi:ABC-type transport system involved in multi-copper enzyme maturation permease subunit
VNTFIFSELTIREAHRRRILWVALLMGMAFLLLFAIGFHYIFSFGVEESLGASAEIELAASLLLIAGLNVVNVLVTLMAVLISVTAVSGEIDSHTIETLVSKPVRRWEVILGKWLAFALLLSIYVLFLAGGLILIVYVRAGFAPQNIPFGLALITLQALIILSVTIAGGTRLSTLANGVLAFTLYGIAFLGGWVEQIGALFRNEAAVNIGIATSLIMPTEALWKKALGVFQPRFANSLFMAGPFAVTSQPSDLMLIYAVVFLIALLVFGVWSFSRRDL